MFHNYKPINERVGKRNHTFSLSKDNEAVRRKLRRRIFTYVEEDDDEANKVSQRKRNGINLACSDIVVQALSVIFGPLLHFFLLIIDARNVDHIVRYKRDIVFHAG